MKHTLLAYATVVAVAQTLSARNLGPENGNSTITAKALDHAGNPVAASIYFWKADEQPNANASQPDFFRDISGQSQVWHDRVTGKSWRPIYSFGAGFEATVKDLGAGDYRATASLGRGPTPYGVSHSIRLEDAAVATNVWIRLETGPTLTIKAVDFETGKSLPFFQAMLIREDGFPVARCSSTPWASSSGEDSALEFEQLSPGNYWLEARKRAFNAEEPEHSLPNGRMAIKIAPGADLEVKARLKGSPLPGEVVRERWPFVVTGRVTDQVGDGIENVSITANCGMGSLLPTGSTKSGKDGAYTLRFAPGMRFVGRANHRVGLQAATISPGKPGYVETNLHRQGDLLMSGQMPTPGELSHWNANTQRVVLPETPYRLDFVLAPAATLKGRLVDESGRPLAGERLHLSGPELPPSCSVLAQTHTDAQGSFEFANIPANRSWWISSSKGADAKTAPLTFTHAKPATLELRLRFSEGKPLLEIIQFDRSGS